MRRLLVGVLILLLAGCSMRSTSNDDAPSASEAAESLSGTDSGDFGTLKDVCGPGTPKSATAQGVTDKEIKVGVFTDVGFSKKSEYVDAAKVFTSWCNDAGGINGRKLVPVTRDTRLYEVRARMLEACREDFALVGGGAALDGTGVEDRLKCLLPEFPAQSSMRQSLGSDLQVLASGPAVGYSRYTGLYTWLLEEAFPSSAGSVGIITGDSPVTKNLAAMDKETLTAMGGKVVYSDLYPAQGVSDWTPYAQSIKKKHVKGLVFLGDFTSLAKLEQALTAIGYAPDWIDSTNNAYNPAFLKLAGPALGTQKNFTELFGTYPREEAADNPATQKVIDLFKKYASGAEITLPVLRAFSAWLLFATAARDCDQLTRACVYENAARHTDWTGGGLQAPVDLTKVDDPPECYVVMQSTAKGWEPADIKPDHGAYRCDAPAYKFKGDYGEPLTLADVGKSMEDVKQDK
ncbi:ABC transporter substrate-binding protein [Streptomyces sp. NPDC002896]|uniref:ABC transporter substrate-binding protein n=1 Tax=Streptomyces sp. NPDC002896 TaxID=3154438 RepID=UPI003317B2A1